MPRALWWSQGGGAVSYERGTPVFSSITGNVVQGSGQRFIRVSGLFES